MEKRKENTDNLTDKAFLRLLITSVLAILVLIACLCSATWAWFSADTTSTGNTLKAGTFELSATVTAEDGTPLKVTRDEAGDMLCSFDAPGIYKVRLEASDASTASKGFCIIDVQGDKPYNTALISEDNRTYPFEFTIDVRSEDGATVRLHSDWRIPTDEDIKLHGVLVIYGKASVE